jgi:hypothetical protein
VAPGGQLVGVEPIQKVIDDSVEQIAAAVDVAV